MVVRLGPLEVRLNPLIVICVVMTVALLLNLGAWQLGRAQDKTALAEAVRARQLEPAQALAEVVSMGALTSEADISALENQGVTAQGHYWNEASFLIAFQFFQGAPGFELITPFQLQETDQWVLVSRGWIAPGPGDEAIPTIMPIEGELAITGHIHTPPAVVGVTQVQGEEWPLRLRRLDMPLAAQVLERPLLPLVVRLAEGEPGLLARHWPAESVTTRNNIGYALQWFGMALLVSVITLFMSTNLRSLLAQRQAEKLAEYARKLESQRSRNVNKQ
jgi:surfeit locus 1 family protein